MNKILRTRNSHIETLYVKGKLNIVHTDSGGNIIGQYNIDNLVVTGGKNYLASRATGNSTPIISHVGLGTGTAVPIVSQTSLTTPVVDPRIAFDTVSVIGPSITTVTTFGPGQSTGPITEAGIFNDSSVGTMFSRVTFGVINKAPGDTMVITWVISIL